MISKTTDNKGRVTLGERFANRTVIIEEVDETEVRITMARVIPERELWLHQNPKAKSTVLKGIKQAMTRKFAGKTPKLDADAKLANQLQDDV